MVFHVSHSLWSVKSGTGMAEEEAVDVGRKCSAACVEHS
jgi:hypothetical protein